MGRKRRRSGSQSWIASLVIGVAVIAIGAGFMLSSKDSKGYSGFPELELSKVEADANSLNGNQYRVDGVVHERVSRQSGEAVCLKVGEGEKAGFLLIKIPTGVKTTNIERLQRFSFVIAFEEGGIAVAQKMKLL